MTGPALAVGWATLVIAWGWSHRPVRRWTPLMPDVPRHRWRARPPTSSRWWNPGTIAAAGVVGGLLFGLPVGLAMAGGMVAARQARAARSVRREAARRQAVVPDAVDLLVVAAAAGLTSRQGIRLLAERGPPSLRFAFGDVASRLEAGEPLAAALPRLTTTVGESARGLVRAIVTAEREGSSIRSLLGRLADDARRQRRHDLQAAVRRLPVRLTFPLACCSLPAFVLLTVIPLLAVGIRRLGPIAL